MSSHQPSGKNMKTKHIKAVSQKVKLFRASEPLLSVLMWGINHSISELSHVSIPVMLMPDDFKANGKIKIDNHLFNKENLPSHFKFKEYCPQVFRNLRTLFSITDHEYLNSFVCSSPIYDDSAGKSGAKFLRSSEGKFVVKTISKEEVELMHNILPPYHQYIVEKHGETLLPQYLGMYRLTVDGAETYMVIMRSIFGHTLPIHRKYDLKGSLIDRQASDKEKAKDLPTYKDIDFLSGNRRIIVGQQTKDQILIKLKSDTDFLSEQKIMDYSLLVGIHDMDKYEQDREEDDAETASQENGDAVIEEEGEDSGSGECLTPPDSPVLTPRTRHVMIEEYDPSIDVYAVKGYERCPRKLIYFMALIDILTHWGAKKKAAQAAKTVKHGAGAEISSVKPEQYAKRFLDFISKVME
ncbi:phosphatidylinositol 5-phosphate 4-kinase type-2 alpha isoform X2 [Strongylocentrotus purpuratus]|uniref:1-phosphatidylinositol-5-phosphate 4-kinase n=1 Tax=Strongylocentrotus purpuratus TaxID=7668 RepID=A0A7M7P5T5_STRPU|nr:phosphatidylinositol 5-phosphate 4-kinase type-2 alpha-like [Strongylocentrotus purpuratus]XP_030846253.1 phosphatidylinositol 5-phosphate 4-kinase type-2 alpha isoform X1 [Strongylocentrotus purpuratus]XP_030846254.1 phosphatidylinositol 5-phosphate 4-kinase type-2 alpha isoform X2 [Strongylocentrotus purpuratus]